MTARYEADPDWQAAWSVIINDDADVADKLEAVFAKYRIERAYTDDPELKPRTMLPLTVLHDSHRRNRVEAIDAELPELNARILELARGVGSAVVWEQFKEAVDRRARIVLERGKLRLQDITAPPTSRQDRGNSKFQDRQGEAG